MTEDNYKGVGLFKFKDKKGADIGLALLNEKTIAMGAISGVQKVIDLSKGEGQSIADGKLKPYLSKIDKGAVFSFVMEFPKESRKVQDGGMFKFDLSKAEALIGNAKYSGSAWEGDIVMISNNPEANEQLVSTLNGLKMMAAAGGPEVVEVVENIELKASADSVTLSFSISDALLEKVKDSIEKKKKGMM